MVNRPASLRQASVKVQPRQRTNFCAFRPLLVKILLRSDHARISKVATRRVWNVDARISNSPFDQTWPKDECEMGRSAVKMNVLQTRDVRPAAQSPVRPTTCEAAGDTMCAPKDSRQNPRRRSKKGCLTQSCDSVEHARGVDAVSSSVMQKDNPHL